MHKFRVFVSYSRENKDLAERLVHLLNDEMGFSVLWDANIQPGTEFNDAIKKLISHSHITIPIFTQRSRKRPWVHQETVYALALGIPVIPLAINTEIDAFLSFLQYIKIKEDLSDLQDQLKKIEFESIVKNPPVKQHSVIEIAELSEERTELMAEYADLIIDEFKEYGYIRQQATFSSFSIPNKNINHSIWSDYEGYRQGNIFDRKLKLKERQVLEKHAREKGLSLIINPNLDLKKRGDKAVKTRLIILLNFLKSLPKEKLKIVVSERGSQGNLTIVGDWFLADSISPSFRGFRQTIFNKHAPTVFQSLVSFDNDFGELLEENNLNEESSRLKSFEIIENRINTLC